MLVSISSSSSFVIAEQFAQPRIVEQQPAVLVDDPQRRRTELQHFAELTLVLGGLGTGARPPFVARSLSRQKTCCAPPVTSGDANIGVL